MHPDADVSECQPWQQQKTGLLEAKVPMIRTEDLEGFMTEGKRSIEIPGFSHRAPIPGAARVGNMLFSSAVSGIDPATGEPAATAEGQVRQVFAHLRALLGQAGGSLADIGHMSVHVRDNSVREPINRAWLEAFPDPHDRPARHIQICALPEPLYLQVEVIAVLSQGE